MTKTTSPASLLTQTYNQLRVLGQGSPSTLRRRASTIQVLEEQRDALLIVVNAERHEVQGTKRLKAVEVRRGNRVRMNHQFHVVVAREREENTVTFTLENG